MVYVDHYCRTQAVWMCPFSEQHNKNGIRSANGRLPGGSVLGGEGSGVGFWVSSRVVERFQMSSG